MMMWFWGKKRTSQSRDTARDQPDGASRGLEVKVVVRVVVVGRAVERGDVVGKHEVTEVFHQRDGVYECFLRLQAKKTVSNSESAAGMCIFTLWGPKS
jgi:hypothetical protein